jgi:excisionase family DNA binding protein
MQSFTVLSRLSETNMAKMDAIELLTPKEAARFLRVATRSFYEMMTREDGPPVIKLSRTAARIPKAELMQWLENRKRNGVPRA